MRACFILCLLFFFVHAARAQEASADSHRTTRDTGIEDKEETGQRGVASYYGKRFHGRRTASGEVFDKEKMTAAHRSLPFGTMVKVTREDNGAFVYVRINDRGPFTRNRLIDLSRKAAEELGIIRRGHQHVIVEVVEEGLLEGWPEIQGWQEVSSQLAFLCAPPLDVPASASSVSPVLVRKAIMIDLPVKN